MVFATGNLVDRHSLQSICNLSWLSDPVSVGITQAQLSLISISAPVDFILIGDKD